MSKLTNGDGVISTIPNPKRDTVYDQIGHYTTIPDSFLKMWSKMGLDAVGLFVYLRFRTSRTRHIAWPAYKTIKKDTGISPRRIARALRILESFGFIERKKRFGKSTEYRITLPRPQ